MKAIVVAVALLIATPAFGQHYFPAAGAGTGSSGPGAQVWNAVDEGWACDGTDGSSAALTLLAEVVAAGGGTIFFPPCLSTYRADSQLLIPNNGGSPQPDQVTVRLTGSGGGRQWYGVNPSVLDLRYTAVNGNAKIETRGRGTLHIDNLTIKDGGASNATPLVHSTNTTLIIHDTTFIGSGNVGQDAIVLGGIDTVLGADVDSPFQGYGTDISNNHFRGLNRGLYGLNYANGVIFARNSFQANVGTIGVEFDGSNGGGQVDHGNIVSDNLFEMDVYTHAIKLTAAQFNTFVGNQYFDPGVQVVSYYLFGAMATQNTFICGYQPNTRPVVSGTAVSIEANTYQCASANETDSGGRGDQSNEFAYGLVVKGTYDGADNYPGQLTVSSQHNPAQNLSLGVDTTNTRTVIESRSTATGWPLHINPLGLGRVHLPDLTIAGDTSTNISIVQGSAQAGDLLALQFGASVNDLLRIGTGGTLSGETNAEGIKYQILTAAALTTAVRLTSDRAIGFNSTATLASGSIDTEVGRIAENVFGPTVAGDGLGVATVAWVRTAPTVTSAGTSPSVTGSNGSAAFRVNVGTGGSATTVVMAMPTATTGWNCFAENITATAANRANQRVVFQSSTTTAVTVQNQTISTGAALAFTASDIVAFQCTAY